MAHLWKRWDGSTTRFGDAVVLGFFLVQFLDGAFTYLGVSTWGLGIEANPLIRAVVTMTGPGIGLAAAKLMAAILGIALHLRRVHNLVAFLTVVYLAGAILPWTAILLTR